MAVATPAITYDHSGTNITTVDSIAAFLIYLFLFGISLCGIADSAPFSIATFLLILLSLILFVISHPLVSPLLIL